jgi:hypothetical protein
MMRHLTTLVLAGVLGTLVMAGNAEACHKKKCGCAPAPVVCAPAPVVCAPVVKTVHCAKPVKVCAPKVKTCGGGGLFAGLCHKKPVATVACATPVSYTYSYATTVPSGQYLATPQGSAQH